MEQIIGKQRLDVLRDTGVIKVMGSSSLYAWININKYVCDS